MAEKKTLYMESTKKEPEETIAEIQQLIKKHKMKRYMTHYDNNGEISGISFVIEIQDREIPFTIMVDHTPLLRLAEAGETKYIKDEFQAKRVAWRQYFRWIEASLALADMDFEDITSIFLAKVQVDEKRTMYDKLIEESNFIPNTRQLKKFLMTNT